MKSAHLSFLTSLEHEFAGLNSYLKLAFLSISIAARPLHSTEILSISEKFGLMPNHLFGETQIKTLNARLSEHILRYGDNSIFFRTAPAVYYMRHLSSVDDPNRAFEVYDSLRRKRGVSKETILVAPRQELKKRLFGNFSKLSEDEFLGIYEDICFFTDRRFAETDTSIKQFVSYTTIRNSANYLVFRRGKFSNPSENLRNTLSIAFGGHISDIDFGLFSDGFEALINNSSRELLEELSVEHIFSSVDDVSSRSRIKGFINVDDNSDARQHVAVVVSVDFPDKDAPSPRELGIADVSWFTRGELQSHRQYFDLWSKVIVDKVLDGTYE